ncbi:MAG: hypothetical protein ACTHK4_05760 [Mycobacteriales bacterium]
MTSIRRSAALPALAALLCTVPVATAQARTAAATPNLVGHLAYVTASGELDVADIYSDGTTGTPQRLGPVTKVASPKTAKAADIVVSSDGSRLAWSEIISKPDPTYGSVQTGARLVVRNLPTGQTITLRTENQPLGFSGHHLIVSGADTKRLVMTPSPHLVKVRDGNAFVVATYPKGLVDVVISTSGSGQHQIETDRLRLTTFGGHHTLLHTYRVGMSYREAAAGAAVSPDGEKLLVERGNHEDFDGLGPSSLFDTFAMNGGHARHQLGHYGTNNAKWRLACATFVGPRDTPWLALHSGYLRTSSGIKVRGVVVRYLSGQWTVESRSAVAVAGNKAGWAVVQSGSWQPVMNAQAGEYQRVPSGQAFLIGPAESHLLPTGVGGSELLWVG